MESTWTLFRVRGIEIGVNWAWLFVFALIAWSLGAGLFPRTYPGLDPNVYLVMGVVAAVLFFVSILLHELGHAFQALKEGMEIDGITLWLLGGVARFKGMFPSAGAEFRIAIAGPIVSVLIAAGFAALNWVGNLLGWPSQIRGVVDYLARINLIVVVFNMVPALPLDGGRVLRSWLWHRKKSFAGATVSAARAGRTFGMVLIGLGLLALFTGAGLGGLWFAVIGWFLIQAGQAEVSFAFLRRALRGRQVRDLMTPEPATVEPGLTIDAFLDDVSRMRGHSTYPVVDGYGSLSGLVSIRHAGQVPREQRTTTVVRDVMLTGDEVPTISPDADVMDALQILQEGPGRAVAIEGGRIAGILSMSDVARTLELEQIREPEATPEGAKGGSLGVWLVILAVVAGGAYFYHPPAAVIAPGESFDISGDIRIDGMEAEAPSGEYLLTSVALRQPNVYGLALAMVRDEQILSLRQVLPEGIDPDEFRSQQQQIFVESQRIAAAAAATAAGMDVDLTGTGARIVGVAPNSPASDVLQQGDVVVAIDGQAVEIVTDLQAAIRARPPGTGFVFTVERDGEELELDIESTRLEGLEGGAGIGVFIETRDFDVTLPFEVTFEQREIGGPSAGLAYALAIYDMIEDEDLAAGRSIAATGTIDISGRIGQVGGVDAKAEAARDAGAELFLVPAGEVSGARGAGITVRGVGSLEDALSTLRS